MIGARRDLIEFMLSSPDVKIVAFKHDVVVMFNIMVYETHQPNDKDFVVESIQRFAPHVKSPTSNIERFDIIIATQHSHIMPRVKRFGTTKIVRSHVDLNTIDEVCVLISDEVVRREDDETLS
jgi:hypothetical protein